VVDQLVVDPDHVLDHHGAVNFAFVLAKRWDIRQQFLRTT
jgi:hypothetical protein